MRHHAIWLLRIRLMTFNTSAMLFTKSYATVNTSLHVIYTRLRHTRTRNYRLVVGHKTCYCGAYTVMSYIRHVGQCRSRQLRFDGFALVVHIGALLPRHRRDITLVYVVNDTRDNINCSAITADDVSYVGAYHCRYYEHDDVCHAKSERQPLLMVYDITSRYRRVMKHRRIVETRRRRIMMAYVAGHASYCRSYGDAALLRMLRATLSTRLCYVSRLMSRLVTIDERSYCRLCHESLRHVATRWQ